MKQTRAPCNIQVKAVGTRALSDLSSYNYTAYIASNKEYE